jgi:hypothetical protein
MLDAYAAGRMTGPAGSSFLPKEGNFARDFLRLFLLPQNYVSAKDSLSGMYSKQATRYDCNFGVIRSWSLWCIIVVRLR